MKLRFLSPIVAVICWAFTGCQHYQPAPLSPAKSAQAFASRSLESPELRNFLDKNLPGGINQWPLPQWTFDQFLLAAFYYNPSLEVARAEWQGVQAGQVTAGARPNPSVIVSPGYSFNPPSDASPWFPLVSFEVPIETAGKRGYRQKRAAHLSDSARLKIASAAWLVRSNLRTAWLDYTTLSEHLKLVDEELALEKKLLSVVEARFKAGAVSAFDVSTARLAIARLQVEADALLRQKAETLARVATAVGVPAAALNTVQMVYDWELPSTTELTTSELRDKALRGRADILSLLAEYEASQAALQLEIAKQYPDVRLGSGYQFDEGEHKWSLSLSMELPVLNRNQGPIAEAKATRAATAARFEALQATVAGEIDRATAGFRGALEHLQTLDNLQAAQKKLRDSVQAQFKAGAADQLEVLNAQVEVLTTDVLKFEARIKALQAFGQLEDAVQKPFAALATVEHSPKLSTKN